MTEDEALQRITDYEVLAMHGSREQLQDALEATTRALHMIVCSVKDENELDEMTDIIEQSMTPPIL